MLHEKIQSTIGLIEDVVDNRQRETDNANVASRNTIFFDSLNQLTPSINSYILARRNFGFDLQDNTKKDLQDLIGYSKTTFDNLKAVNPKPFKSKVDSFINAVAQEWTNFFDQNNNELINQLNIISFVHDYPMLVRNCISSLKKCAEWPLTQEAISTYTEAIEKANEMLKQMRFDAEIKQFLIKVRDKNATLAEITPTIMKWIQDENISEKVCLSIKNT